MGTAERVALNEDLFREVNERIKELAERFGDAGERCSFVCECSDSGCAVQVELTLTEYAAIRRHPRRFVAAPGHEDPHHERIVTRTDRYLVVEKNGEAGEITERLDAAP